jgi:hypothetical protein
MAFVVKVVDFVFVVGVEFEEFIWFRRHTTDEGVVRFTVNDVNGEGSIGSFESGDKGLWRELVFGYWVFEFFTEFEE